MGKGGGIGLLALLLVGALLALWAAREVSDVAPPASPSPPTPTRAAGSDPAHLELDPPAGEASTAALRVPSEGARPAPRTVRVRVVDDASVRPVAGARVASCDLDLLLGRLAERRLDYAGRAALREALSTVVTTDHAGRALLEALGTRLLIDVTTDDGRWARALSSSADEDVVLRVTLDRTLRVRAVREGHGLAGVPIELRTEAPTTAETAGDGVAVFPHVQRRLAAGRVGALAFAFPFVGRAGRSVRADDARAVVDLVLPPTGSLELFLRDAAGRPPGADTVRLSLRARDPAHPGAPLQPVDGGWARPPCGADGVARVPWLGLGLALDLTVEGAGPSEVRPLSLEVAGPTRAGEVTRVDVEWPPSDPSAHRPVVTGRFVRSDGSPWAATEVSVRAELFPFPAASPPTGRDLRTDPDGRFRLVVCDEWPLGGRRVLRVRTRAELDGAPAEARLDLSRDLGTEETEVGDVLLAHGPLLAAGRVSDDTGLALAGARVTLSQAVTGYWPRVDASGGECDDAGRFALYLAPGEALPGAAVRLQARREGHLTAALEIALGQEDAQLVLARAGALAGSVQLLGTGPRGGDRLPGDLELALRGRDLEGAERAWAPRIRADGTFEQDGLPPGLVTLELSLRGQTEGSVVVEAIQVEPARTTRDPRVQGLAPPSPARAEVCVTVLGPDRTPVAGANVRTGEQVAAALVRTDADGRALLAPRELPVDVAIDAYGFRTEHLRLDEGEHEIVLRGGCQVLLVTDVPTIGAAPDHHLGFTLYDVDEEGRRRMPTHMYAFPWEKAYFDADRTCHIVAPGPGTYDVELRLFVSGDDGIGRGGPLGPDVALRIEVLDLESVQRFEVPVGAQALARALERYAR